MMGSKRGGPSAPALRKDPYEIFCVSMDASDQEIKTVYRKLALKMLGAIFPGCRVCQVSKGAASNAGLYILFPIPSHHWSKVVWTVVEFPSLNAGMTLFSLLLIFL